MVFLLPNSSSEKKMVLNVELQLSESLPVTKIGYGLMLKELATIFGLGLIPIALG